MHSPLVSNSRASHTGGISLPLFRQEALDYQQQKFYGDIILIRPLSLTLLTWLAIAILAFGIAVLGFGRYTEKLRLPVFPAAGAENQIELHMPGRWLKLVRPGAQISIRCTCPAQIVEAGTVLAVSKAPLTPGAQLLEPAYKVTVSLTPIAAQTLGLDHPPQSQGNLEAEIPLGHKRLIQWFFGKPAS